MMRTSTAAGAALACVAFAALLAPFVGAQDGTAAVRAAAERGGRTHCDAEGECDSYDVIKVDVSVENVSDLGAFEFVLTFDSSILKLDSNAPFEQGPFLASTGRQTLCNDPVVDAGAARFECVTLGATPREGATGSGLLGSVFFTPEGDGKATIQFTRAGLSNPPGDEIPAEWLPEEIEVEAEGGTSWLIWLGIGAGAAALALAGGALLMRQRVGTMRPSLDTRAAGNEDTPSTSA